MIAVFKEIFNCVVGGDDSHALAVACAALPEGRVVVAGLAVDAGEEGVPGNFGPVERRLGLGLEFLLWPSQAGILPTSSMLRKLGRTKPRRSLGGAIGVHTFVLLLRGRWCLLLRLRLRRLRLLWRLRAGRRGIGGGSLRRRAVLQTTEQCFGWSFGRRCLGQRLAVGARAKLSFETAEAIAGAQTKKSNVTKERQIP